MTLLTLCLVIVACVVNLPNTGAGGAPGFECLDLCNKYLLREVADSKLTATSSWQHLSWPHGAQESRLDNKFKALATVGAWVANNDNKNQYIQVELENVSKIRGIITQGRPKGPTYTSDETKQQWVKTYKILYSMDGVTFKTVKVDDGSKDMVFNGNSDADTKITNKLTKPVLAKFVRLNPQSWNQHIGMRWDLVGC